MYLFAQQLVGFNVNADTALKGYYKILLDARVDSEVSTGTYSECRSEDRVHRFTDVPFPAST